MAEPIDWSRFDTQAHRTTQANCRHVIHCAVDAATRKAISDNLAYARRIGDVAAFPLLIAQLSGPCCLPAASPPPPGSAPQLTLPTTRQPPTATTTATENDDDTET